MNTLKTNIRKIDFGELDALDDAAKSFAKQNGVPSTTFPSQDQAHGEGGQQPPVPTPRLRKATSPLNAIVPTYVMKQIKDRCTNDDVTMRFLVLIALRSIGIDVKPEDMVEDGRRAHS